MSNKKENNRSTGNKAVSITLGVIKRLNKHQYRCYDRGYS